VTTSRAQRDLDSLGDLVRMRLQFEVADFDQDTAHVTSERVVA
jgi:hypothetical protein